MSLSFKKEQAFKEYKGNGCGKYTSKKINYSFSAQQKNNKCKKFFLHTTWIKILLKSLNSSALHMFFHWHFSSVIRHICNSVEFTFSLTFQKLSSHLTTLTNKISSKTRGYLMRATRSFPKLSRERERTPLIWERSVFMYWNNSSIRTADLSMEIPVTRKWKLNHIPH